MLSKQIIGKCNLLNLTIYQELFNMGTIWKFQMLHCIIKNMYANKLFKIGIIYYSLYVMFLFWELGAVASNVLYTCDSFFTWIQCLYEFIMSIWIHFFIEFIYVLLPTHVTLFYMNLMLIWIHLTTSVFFLNSFILWIHLGVDTMAPKDAKKRMKAEQNNETKVVNYYWSNSL